MAGEVGDARLLELLVAGTARETGSAFFSALVRHLADATETRRACVAEVLSPDRVRILACWPADHVFEPNEMELTGPASADVIHGAPVSIVSGTADRYPWTTRKTDGYTGVPLRAADSTVIGHLCVFDEAPLSLDERRRTLLELFAARAAGELDRRRIEQRLLENEERLKDLFDEAPIAYVQEDFDSRFIRANHEALRILGLRPDQV